MAKGRRAGGLGILAVFGVLSLAAHAQQPPAQGVVAQGTATLSGPHGDETGTITVSAWGEQYCKVSITLGPPVLRRTYTAVLNGKSAVVTGPADIVAAVPLPASPNVGCGLVPEGLAYDRLAASGAGSLALDPGTQLPVSAAWTFRGLAVSLQYAGYQPGAALPLAASVTESVGGQVRLRAKFASIAAKTFTSADFALPARPNRTAPGGGQ